MFNFHEFDEKQGLPMIETQNRRFTLGVSPVQADLAIATTGVTIAPNIGAPPFNASVIVESIRPTVLIESPGAGQTFTKEVVQAMSSFNEKPIILALSNSTTQSECTAEQAYTWSEGRAIFASGGPFAPVEYNGKRYVSGQSNNAYIFPGFGLGLIISVQSLFMMTCC